ncbi:hypothetical protein WJX74_004626 [Apatococcus lobatus]|uniref:Major facilitator superfamily (MFS) profile domain-containing protein n=1 Tax=Apatococcus lobatus TaxID=904363 RepID=A0AAW1S694_9CHLO
MLTRNQTIALWLCLLNEATQIELPFVIAVFMVRHWLGANANQEDVVGRMTGLLAATFPAAQFVSAIGWGRVSDGCGRKPLIVMSNVSSMLAAVGFGLAPTWGLAMTARMLGGLFNCTFLNVKAMLGELCEPSEQGRTMSTMGATWGCAAVIAPVIGGFLAEPCTQYGPWVPFCSRGALLNRQPFLLPCLAAAILSCLALFCSTLLLQETLPSIVARRQMKGLLPQPAHDQVLAKSGFLIPGHLELTVLPEAQRPGLRSPSGASPGHVVVTSEFVEDPENMENAALLANMQQPLRRTQPAPKASSSPLKPMHDNAAELSASAKDVDHVADHTTKALQANVLDGNEVHLPGGDLVRQALQGQAETPLDTRVHAALGPAGFIPPADLHPASINPPSKLPPAAAPVSTLPSERDNDAHGTGLHSHAATAAGMASQGNEDDDSHGQDPEQQALLAADSPGTGSTDVSSSKAAADGLVKHRWHRDRQVQLTLAGYTSICFVYILFDEMVPMYSSAPHQAGGLGLKPSQLALPLMASGPIMFVWSIWGYPFLEAWLGGVTPTMRWNLAAAAVLTPLVPTASAFVPFGTTAVLLCLAVTLSFCRMIGNNMFSCASGLINLAAPKAQLGIVNAVGSLLAAGVRSVGPALGGLVWGSSIAIPAHQYTVFCAMSLGLLSILLIYARVRI